MLLLLFVISFDLPNLRIFCIVHRGFYSIVVVAFSLNFVCKHFQQMVRTVVPFEQFDHNHGRHGQFPRSLEADLRDSRRDNCVVLYQDAV